MYYVLTLTLFLFPTISFAQSEGSLQLLLVGIGGFINVVLIPFILGVAFLIFIINAVRFFIIDGSNTEGHENARNLALYGVGAFVLILSLWGMVNILANGIGLNEGPCINGKAVQSDYLYGIDSNAPCSSIRPTPRPVSRPDTTSPGGNFGQGVPGAVPGGSTVGSGGSGVILPGTDTPPVTPGSPPTSFTPDGNDFNYAPVATLATQVRTDTVLFFNSDLRTLVGTQNLTSVQRALFSDIAAPQTGTPEKDRVVALLRLERLGKLPTGTAQKYFLAVERYQSLTNTPTDARIQNFAGLVTESTRALPLPPSATAKQTVTRQEIDTLMINDTDIFGKTKLNTSARQVILTNLYDTTKTPTEKISYLDNLIRTTVEDTNSHEAIVASAARAHYIQDLNTQILFSGGSTMLR